MKTKIMYEDEQVLVCHKPAGLATQSARVGQPDVVSELKKHLVAKESGGSPKRTEPYLGIVHRLDQPVEGLLVFAKTKSAAAHLTKQLEAGSLNKQYYATVCGNPDTEAGELVDYLLKEGNLAKVVAQGTPLAKKAVLQYKVLERDLTASVSRLDIHIDTGRFHQIRCQLAHAGWPILGDSKYGTPQSLEVSGQQGLRNVALLAYRLEFIHPKTGKKCEYNIS